MRHSLALAFLLVSAGWLAGQDLKLPDRVGAYEPIVVEHEAGARVQVLPWGTSVPSFLDEKHIKRFADHTVFAAPPGAYLVAAKGELAIVIIEGSAPVPPGPGPQPPGPNPPGPGPTPPTPPGPQPDVPTDEFNNIGQLANKTLSVLTQEERQRYLEPVRAAYEKTAAKMADTSAALTLNDGLNYLQMELGAAFPSGRTEGWRKWGQIVNDHVAKQQIDRQKFGPLCSAIAKGLR